MKSFLIATALLFSLCLHSQTNTAARDTGTVIVEMPPEVEALLERHKAYIDKLEGVPGYRIHVAMASSLPEIRNAKKNFDEIFTGTFESEVVYYPPRYRLVVGNYRDKLKAYHDLLIVREAFPKAFLSKGPIDILAP